MAFKTFNRFKHWQRCPLIKSRLKGLKRKFQGHNSSHLDFYQAKGAEPLRFELYFQSYQVYSIDI